MRIRRCPASVTGTKPARSHCSAPRNGKARGVGRRKPEDPGRPASTHTLSRERRSNAGSQRGIGSGNGEARRGDFMPCGRMVVLIAGVLAGGFRSRGGAGAGADGARRRHGDAHRGEGLGAGVLGERRDAGRDRTETVRCSRGRPAGNPRGGGPAERKSREPGEHQDPRGAASHTLVMIDGFPVNSPSIGGVRRQRPPRGGFERIEVVRGAQSALYGSNAMCGVVNFLPGEGGGRPGSTGRLAGGELQHAPVERVRPGGREGKEPPPRRLGTDRATGSSRTTTPTSSPSWGAGTSRWGRGTGSTRSFCRRTRRRGSRSTSGRRIRLDAPETRRDSSAASGGRRPISKSAVTALRLRAPVRRVSTTYRDPRRPGDAPRSVLRRCIRDREDGRRDHGPHRGEPRDELRVHTSPGFEYRKNRATDTMPSSSFGRSPIS